MTEKTAITDINKDNIYVLMNNFQSLIKSCEVFNEKKGLYENRECYVCLRLVKKLKTDKTIKITY